MTLNREEKRALSRYRLDKADRLLADAGLLLEQGRWESAVNRSYYAALSAARAILILFGGDPRTHEGVKTMVNQKLVLGGYLSKEYGRWFRELLFDREEVDYADYVTIDKADAAAAVERAEHFIREAKRIVERLDQESMSG
ncbi:MAG TPA: HEPN domain-containing protein [Nitrospiraceae bacterium]|jgi:hypothetical protein|nr:HEPN domain-containing protein [Nitrospiraceae bacterium]